MHHYVCDIASHSGVEWTEIVNHAIVYIGCNRLLLLTFFLKFLKLSD